MSLDAVYMLRDAICGAFTHRVGRWQANFGVDGKETNRHALLICFRIKKKHVQMVIHAPANYVGVYIRKEKGKWDCICYHDSCWRSEIDRFLFEHREDMHFALTPSYAGDELGTTAMRVTDAIFVVALPKEQLEEFSQIRKKRYG